MKKLFPIPWNIMQRWNVHKQQTYQELKIQEFMHILTHSSYYSSLFTAHSIKPKHIKTLEDIKKIPFTTKEDIIRTQESPEKASTFVLDPTPHLSSFVSQLQILFSKHLKENLMYEFKPIHAYFTSGKSSTGIPIFYTQQDMQYVNESAKRMMQFLNIPHSSRVINLFPATPTLPFWYMNHATAHTNMFCLASGKTIETERILDNIEHMRAEVLTGTTSYIYHLITKAAEEKRSLASLKYIILGAEGITQDHISKMKHLLTFCHADTVTVYSTYGFAEGKILWTQCHEESGYHLYPDMEYIEIIDKEGNRVPNGQSGEIVYTGFGFRGTALLRYKTGDIGRLQEQPCPYCNAKTPRLEPAIIRTSEIIPLQLTRVKKRYIDFNAVSVLLSSLPFVQEWQIVLKKTKLDEIIIDIAVAKGIEHTFAKNEIIRLLHSTFGFTPIIEFKKKEIIVENLGLESHFAEKRIVDER